MTSMESRRVRRAVILAAGMGTRMRPLTDNRPKALLPVCGRPLIDWTLDRLAAHGVERVMVNAHWQADRLIEHLARRHSPAIEVRREAAPLETGGGVRNMLDALGPEPFFVVNVDALWLDGLVSALDRLDAAWDGARMDALLLLHRVVHVHGYDGPGDFFLDPVGRLRRRRAGAVAPHLFAGVHITRPELLADEPHEAFSMTRVWDRSESDGRLFGLVHDGLWFHLSTPGDITHVERVLDQRFVDRVG
jgi:MurNAc alpha-1-phosphate uridylyltransferase